MTARINSPDPSVVDAAADLLDPGEDPELGILIAARQERLRGGLSDETVEALESLDVEGRREVQRQVFLCDHYRDTHPGFYALWLDNLRLVSPLNATRCDADDAYRRAEWLEAEMLYRAAGEASDVAVFRDEQLDRARDSRRQAWRDGLVPVAPGSSMRPTASEWEWAQRYTQSVQTGNKLLAQRAVDAMKARDDWRDPMALGARAIGRGRCLSAGVGASGRRGGARF